MGTPAIREEKRSTARGNQPGMKGSPEEPAFYGWSVGLDVAHPDQVIEQVQEGFSMETVERFKKKLELTNEEVAELINISLRTLARRQKQGHLKQEESDRLYRMIRLYEHAVDVLDTEEEAQMWLKRAQWGLGGEVPLQYARTEPGAREVEVLLDRIDYGVLA